MLPCYRVLIRCSHNRFRDLSTDPLEPSQLRDAFSSVQELSLNSTLLSWEEVSAPLSYTQIAKLIVFQITTLIQPFSSLRTLFLASNNLTTIPTPPPLPTLTTLSLAHNPLPTLQSIQLLTHLPSLHTLSLQSCVLGISPLTPLAQPFPALTTLNLSHNALPTLATLSTLPPSFPHLTALRTTGNPFLAPLAPDTAHLLTIARLPHLTTLNFARVPPAERDNAERYYLAQIAAELAGAPAEREVEVLAAHPRWEELCEVHDKPFVRRRAAAGDGGDGEGPWPPGSLGARLVTLRLRRAADGEAEGGGGATGVRELVVPRSVNVDRLRALVGREFEVWPGRVRLVWETGEWDFAAAGPGDDDPDAWSVGSSGESEGEATDGKSKEKQHGNRVPRQVELAQGTRPLGFWVEGTEADIRVEVVAQTQRP